MTLGVTKVTIGINTYTRGPVGVDPRHAGGRLWRFVLVDDDCRPIRRRWTDETAPGGTREAHVLFKTEASAQGLADQLAACRFPVRVFDKEAQ